MEIVKFVDSCGQKRKGVKKICSICNNEFITRINRAELQLCCSGKCASKLHSKNNRVDCLCSWCQKSFTRPKNKLKNSKSGFYFCSRKCKDEAQKLGGIKEIMPDHYGSGLYSNESLVRQLKSENKQCVDCDENRYYLLCVHHIDSDRTNNVIENLEIVCYNCHIKRHLDKLRDGTLVVNFKKLTPRELLNTL